MPDQPVILVVDDQPKLLSGLELTLNAAGYRVQVAEDGHLALERLCSEAVDLILADIAMPEVDGYTFIARVRARHPDLPAIAMTAHARIEDRRRALAAGYTGYRTKPIDGPQLIVDAVDLLARRATSRFRSQHPQLSLKR